MFRLIVQVICDREKQAQCAGSVSRLNVPHLSGILQVILPPPLSQSDSTFEMQTFLILDFCQTQPSPSQAGLSWLYFQHLQPATKPATQPPSPSWQKAPALLGGLSQLYFQLIQPTKFQPAGSKIQLWWASFFLASFKLAELGTAQPQLVVYCLFDPKKFVT